MSGRHVGRRNAAAGGVAMLILAAAAAGSAKAAELDGELLSSVAEYHRLVAQDKAAWDRLKDAETASGAAAARLTHLRYWITSGCNWSLPGLGWLREFVDPAGKCLDFEGLGQHLHARNQVAVSDGRVLRIARDEQHF